MLVILRQYKHHSSHLLAVLDAFPLRSSCEECDESDQVVHGVFAAYAVVSADSESHEVGRVFRAFVTAGGIEPVRIKDVRVGEALTACRDERRHNQRAFGDGHLRAGGAVHVDDNKQVAK